MNILSRFIIVNDTRIPVSDIYHYRFDMVSRSNLRIYIPYDNATFEQCENIMHNNDRIEEWAVVRNDDGTEEEKLITVHTNYTKDSSLELNADKQYPNNWMINIVRKSEAEVLADFNNEMIQANEMALLDVYETIMSGVDNNEGVDE